jgi:uncharacterized membrane protein (DUF4010 family)
MDPATAADLTQIFLKLGIALGLGLLVGLQRERAASRLAGFRTFPLVTVLGTVTALLGRELGGTESAVGGWVVAAGLLGVAGLIISANLMLAHAEAPDPGQTTEVALLLMFAVGAYLAVGSSAVAVALGGGTAVLLQLKEQLHGLAGRMGERDFRAIIQFVLITLVILPVLPDRTYGPFEVLNPREIWWMVVLIVGISLGGYVGYKLLGRSKGTLLAGLLGGLVSSTATTVSYARRSSEGRGGGETVIQRGGAVRRDGLTRTSAVVILLASAVVFVRVLVEIAVVARSAFPVMAPPLAALLGVGLALAAVVWLAVRGEPVAVSDPGNPSELRPAIVFGFLYAVVLLAVAAAKEHWQGSGLWVVSVLSGLTDMDAITLSTSRLVQAGRLDPGLGWQLILLASLSNLVFKGAIVGVLGSRGLAWRIAGLFGVLLVAGALVLTLWP